MTISLNRILLVEDNAHDAEMTLEALSEQHLANEVIVVPDGAEALDYLYCRGKYRDRQRGNPVLALLDLKMPKIDGLEVLRIVKQDPLLRAIPVVMLTSSREEQDLIRSYALGVNAYIVKPVVLPAFLSAVRQIGSFWAILNEPPPAAFGHP